MAQPTRNRTKIHELLVENWNLKHRVGAAVTVTMDNGSLRASVTRSPAQMLGGHTAVIWLDGISGAYSLERVTAIERAPVHTEPIPPSPSVPLVEEATD